MEERKRGNSLSDPDDYGFRMAPRAPTKWPTGNERYPPRRRSPAPAPGQSYTELVAKHGRPFGAFDKERQLPYGATGIEARNDFRVKE